MNRLYLRAVPLRSWRRPLAVCRDSRSAGRMARALRTTRRQDPESTGTARIGQHVGSTAVQGLPAKSIIDVDLIVADPNDEPSYVPALENVGFELRVREPWWFGHRVLRHADPSCHLHVFGYDSPEIVKHRIFRDWLRANPMDRDLYADTKREAAAKGAIPRRTLHAVQRT
jgi:GrpB-like predicted nucleotidyltransferase (UPF0157 family)